MPIEKAQIRAKHGHYFLTLIETSQKASVQALVKCAKDEHQNLLAALAWSQESDEALVGLRLGNALAQFWQTQSYFAEGKDWLAKVLSHPGAISPTEERVKALLGAARIASRQSDRTLAQVYGQEALVIFTKPRTRRANSSSLLGLRC